MLEPRLLSSIPAIIVGCLNSGDPPLAIGFLDNCPSVYSSDSSENGLHAVVASEEKAEVAEALMGTFVLI